MAEQVQRAVGGSLDGVTVAAWGLTFKAGTDDLRDSPALSVLERIRRRGAVIRAFDPTRPAPGNGHLAGLDLQLVDDPYECCRGASAVVVLTEWPEFRDYDLVRAASLMVRAELVDTRNMFHPQAARVAGMAYTGMGRS